MNMAPPSSHDHHLHIQFAAQGADSILKEPDAELCANDSYLLAKSSPPPTPLDLNELCTHLEYYFSDDNLRTDFYVLKNMNIDGYVQLSLFLTFKKIKRLTTELSVLRDAVKQSSKIHLNEENNMVGRNDPLRYDQTYSVRISKIAIAYNLPDDANSNTLTKIFSTCGQIKLLLYVKNGRSECHPSHILKPPVTCNGNYAIIEYSEIDYAKKAVEDFTDSNDWRNGMQVVMYVSTASSRGRLQRKSSLAVTMERQRVPVVIPESEVAVDRRRAISTASAPPRPSHVEAVGEGLDGLREGKSEHGTIYSIRGAGGLINPTKYPNSCISFRIIADENGECPYKVGDHVNFTVGRNKKSGRKYASRVVICDAPPVSLASFAPTSSDSILASPRSTSSRAPGLSSADSSTVPGAGGATSGKDYFASNARGSWLSRRRSSNSLSASPTLTRRRSFTTSKSPPSPLSRKASEITDNSQAYRQALGPDGTRGFKSRQPIVEPSARRVVAAGIVPQNQPRVPLRRSASLCTR